MIRYAVYDSTGCCVCPMTFETEADAWHELGLHEEEDPAFATIFPGPYEIREVQR